MRDPANIFYAAFAGASHLSAPRLLGQMWRRGISHLNAFRLRKNLILVCQKPWSAISHGPRSRTVRDPARLEIEQIKNFDGCGRDLSSFFGVGRRSGLSRIRLVRPAVLARNTLTGCVRSLGEHLYPYANSKLFLRSLLTDE